MSNSDCIGLAVVGGHRGASMNRNLALFEGQARLAAACDLDEAVLTRWRADLPGLKTYADYEALLADEDVDAVYLATPMPLHARQAIQALERGKHVLSEVIAATTLDECWALVEAVERSGLVYMLAENYCYMRPNMMVRNMVERGVFGEIAHAEGAYIHDCRTLLHTRDGELTWRGKLQRDWNCASYPTHSLGPVAQWLSINRAGGDRLVGVVAGASPALSVRRHFRDRYGNAHPGAQAEFWRHGDSQVVLLQTAKGALVVIRVDWTSARPHNMTHYALQGTTASYLSPRHGKEDPLIWIEGRSPGAEQGHAEWESLWNYAAEYEHPYWREWGELGQKAGHGGGDYFIFKDFLRAVREGGRPAIDVYDAVTWSSIAPLSAAALAKGGGPVEVPDFRAGRRKGA